MKFYDEISSKQVTAKYPPEELFGCSVPFVAAKLSKGEMLFFEGAEPADLFCMVEGSVLLNMHGENGRKASLCVLHAPAFFGELEMLSVLPHTVEVEALEDCIFYCVDADEAAVLMKTNSVFLNRLFDYVSHRSAILAQRLMRAFTGSLESRLAEFILEFRRGDFYTESDGFAAAYLGVSDRRIRTIMADFRRQGILQKSGRHDRIAAEEKLFDLAGAPSLIV